MKKTKRKINLRTKNPTTDVEILQKLKEQNSELIKELDDLIELVSKPKNKRK